MRRGCDVTARRTKAQHMRGQTLRTTRASWLAAIYLLYGCAGTNRGPSSEELRAMEEERKSLETLLQRGRFELQCPEATAQVLERYQDGPATLVGIEGCGRQAIYERRLRYSYHTRSRTTRNTKWERKP